MTTAAAADAALARGEEKMKDKRAKKATIATSSRFENPCEVALRSEGEEFVLHVLSRVFPFSLPSKSLFLLPSPSRSSFNVRRRRIMGLGACGLSLFVFQSRRRLSFSQRQAWPQRQHPI